MLRLEPLSFIKYQIFETFFSLPLVIESEMVQIAGRSRGGRTPKRAIYVPGNRGFFAPLSDENQVFSEEGFSRRKRKIPKPSGSGSCAHERLTTQQDCLAASVGSLSGNGNGSA